MPAISFPTSPTIGQTVTVSGKNYVWDGTVWAVVGVNVPIAINDLTDVDTVTTSPVSGNYLRYNGTNWTPGTVASALSGLSDVTLTSPANSNYLTYDSTSSKWVNTTLNTPSSNRNRVVNGDMRITQKMRGSSVANDNYTNDYVVDKFFTYSFTQNGLYTSGRNLHGSLPGSGFNNYLGVRVGATGYDFVANGSSYGAIHHMIEGNEVADLLLGTSSAKTFTVSFWFYTSVAGNYSMCVRSKVGTASTNRHYIHQFTVPANTWTYVTATIPGATSGTWFNTPGSTGIYLMWLLGAGSTFTNSSVGSWLTPTVTTAPYQSTTSVNFLSTANAIMALTGVQLEAGSTATPFESLDYARSLLQCQRFYYDYKYADSSNIESPGSAFVVTTTTAYGNIVHPIMLAKTPTISVSGLDLIDYIASASVNVSSVTTIQSSRRSVALQYNLASASTVGRTLFLRTSGANGSFAFDSNLAQGDSGASVPN